MKLFNAIYEKKLQRPMELYNDAINLIGTRYDLIFNASSRNSDQPHV